jgi:hypothetical protein
MLFSDFTIKARDEIANLALVSEMNLRNEEGRMILVLNFESEIDKLAFKIKYGGNYV